MKIKVTYPIRDGDHVHQAGVIVWGVDEDKAREWIAAGWCYEIVEKVKHEPKPAKKH